MVGLNVLKEGVFKDIEKASEVEFSDKDLLHEIKIWLIFLWTSDTILSAVVKCLENVKCYGYCSFSRNL